MPPPKAQDGTQLQGYLAQSAGGLYLAAIALLVVLVAVLILDGAVRRNRQPAPVPAPAAAQLQADPAQLQADPAQIQADPAERTEILRQLGDMGRELAEAGAERDRLLRRIEELLALHAELEAGAPADGRGGLPARLAEIERELAAVARALEAAEQRMSQRQMEVAGLGGRLNRALVAKAEELRKSRSDFLARLQSVLGQRPGFRMDGDRFTLPAEILFSAGSDRLSPKGAEEVRRLAATINAVRGEFPPDLAWVLRVSGHTDRQPIANARFPSNWELSALRAVTVVKALVDDGIPPEHLLAAGFGEHQPLSAGRDGAVSALDRRIEFRIDTP